MPGILESSAKWPPQGLRQRGSDASISYRSNYSSDSISSIPPSPTPKLSSPSPRAIEISTAFERVTDLSTSLQTVFLKNSSEAVVATRKRVKEFQAAVADFFDELRRLPDDVPSTPALISAVQGCSFEVHCFGASAEAFRVGYQERQREELVIMLRGAMESMCVLIELAAQAMEDAGAERKRLEELTDLETTKAERGTGTTLDGRPMSWLVAANVNGHAFGKLDFERNASSTGHLSKASLMNFEEPHMTSRESSRPSTPNKPVFSRKEPLIPTKRPSKGKYDVRHLRQSVHLHLTADPPPLRDSLAIIAAAAPFPANLPKTDPDNPDAAYIEYNADGSMKKANLRGLVGVITSGSAIEHEEFVSMVLMTFRLFASGEKLADALYLRYTEQRPEWLSHKGKMQLEWSMAQTRMKSRVATVLHLWLELHWKPEDCGAISRLQELIETVEKDCVFHARSLRLSLDRIVEDKDRYHGKRFRTEERYKPTMVPPPPTSFEARKDLAALAARNQSDLRIVHFATPEGVEEFARMITMVESKYYRRMSPENFVHYKSKETQKIRKELGDFEQRYKAWIVWTIVTPEDPLERAHVIEFWFEVAKICVRYRNFNTAHQITCVLGDPEFEKMGITRQVLEQLDRTAVHEFWKVCRLYENEAWWSEMNSSSLPAIPVSHIVVRWRIYIEECGLRELCKQTRDICLPEFKSKGRIDVGSFLNLANLIWDIERTFEPHALGSVRWIESWFLAQVFTPDITDFGLETRHFRTGVAKDNPAPVVPDTILAKLVAAFEAKLQRKEVELIPLVPRKPSIEVIRKKSTNKLKKRPSALTLHSHPNQFQPSTSRPGTPTSQDPDSPQRQPRKLHRRSRSFTRSSESVQGVFVVQPPPSPLVHAHTAMTRNDDQDRALPASEAAYNRQIARARLGPPPSPSHGKRFGDIGAPRRGSPEKVVRMHPSQVVGYLPSSPKKARPPQHDWEII